MTSFKFSSNASEQRGGKNRGKTYMDEEGTPEQIQTQRRKTTESRGKEG